MTRGVNVCYLPDFLICPQCFTVQEAPYIEGDGCICGGRLIDGKAVRNLANAATASRTEERSLLPI